MTFILLINLDLFRKEVESPNTVYKTVDFVKTEAFNKTKKNQDQKYNIHAN